MDAKDRPSKCKQKEYRASTDFIAYRSDEPYVLRSVLIS